MFLESVDRSAVEQYQIPSNGIVGETAATFETWHDWEPTILMHHGKLCCETSREWMTATDFSTLNGGNLLAGPRWLRERFKWGACSHPIHWCETVRKKTLDCGALAALAQLSTQDHVVTASAGNQCGCNIKPDSLPYNWFYIATTQGSL